MKYFVALLLFCSAAFSNVAFCESQQVLLQEISVKQKIIGELQEELSKVQQVQTKEGLFYPIPNLLKWTAAGAASLQLLEAGYVALNEAAYAPYGKIEAVKTIHQQLRSRAAVFLGTLALFAVFRYWSQPTEKVILITTPERQRLVSTLTKLSEDLGHLKAHLEETHIEEEIQQ